MGRGMSLLLLRKRIIIEFGNFVEQKFAVQLRQKLSFKVVVEVVVQWSNNRYKTKFWEFIGWV